MRSVTGVPRSSPVSERGVTTDEGGTRSGPLAGVRILDMTMNMAGPLATMVLADQGADVVKVEPPDGDVIRKLGTAHGDTSPYFANLNRNKRSVVVDVQRPSGLAIVHRLAEQSDVFVQNLRYGVAERLGVGQAELRRRNPRLIYVSITGYGTTGPLHELPAYDHVVQALSGIAARQQGPDGQGSLVRQGIIDKATAYSAAEAITAALYARERGGEARSVELSLLDAALNFLWPDGMMGRSAVDEGMADGRDVARSFRTTKTSDGDIVVVTLTGAQWSGLMDAVGLQQDELSDSIAARQQHGGEAMREVARRLQGMTSADAVARLQEHGVPSAPVVGLDDVHHVPQIVAAESLVEYQHPVLGTVRQPHPAARFSDAESAASRPAPRPAPGLGADTDDLLRELGCDDHEIAALRDEGTIGA